MIEVRARAEFRADFPDDGVEGEFGYTRFPGKGLAAAIGEMLEAIGCAVSSPLNADEHGWELRVEFKQERMWCQVTTIDAQDNILLFTGRTLIGNFSNSPAYLEAITRLNLEMGRDPRFHDIRWSRQRGPKGPGSDTPLDVELDQLPKPAPRRGWFWWAGKKAGQGSEAT